MTINLREKLISVVDEIQLNDRQEFIESLFSGPVEYCMISEDFNICLWNAGAVKLYGYAPSEIIGQSIFSLFPSDQKENVKNIFETALKEGKWTGNVTRIKKDKKEIKVHINCIYSKESNKSYPYILISRPISNIMDILDDSPGNEKKLNKEIVLLKTLLDSSKHYAVLGLNLTKKIIECNAAAHKLFGYSLEEMLNEKILSLKVFNQVPAAEIEDFFTETLKNEDATRIFTIKNAQQELLVISFILATRKNDKDEIIGYVLICKDITAEKNIESKLKEKNELLEEFSSVVSHDLRAPLRAIQNLSGWIKEDEETVLSEDAKKLFSELEKRSVHMSNLIENILEYSQAGVIHANKEDINTTKLLKEIIHELNPSNKLQITIAPNIPTLKAAITPLRQVFSNLIGNSIKYHDKSNGLIEIGANEQEKGFIQFFVKDNGPGIDLTDPNWIFSINNTMKNIQNGFGLTIVKKIVEAQGGEISVESQLGKGTTIFFTWPKD